MGSSILIAGGAKLSGAAREWVSGRFLGTTHGARGSYPQGNAKPHPSDLEALLTHPSDLEALLTHPSDLEALLTRIFFFSICTSFSNSGEQL